MLKIKSESMKYKILLIDVIFGQVSFDAELSSR